MFKRRRFKQETTLQERLDAYANAARAKASELPPGEEREGFIEQARQAETAAHMDGWLNSPGLRSPK